MKVPADFVMLCLALVGSLSVFSLAAPAKHELMGIKGAPETKAVRHQFFHVNRFQLPIAFDPSKDPLTVLRSLRKIQGPNLRSPVCTICSMQEVDADIYNYFCLPDSDGMDGEICDKLTVVGTTPAHDLNIVCKILLSRHTKMCQ